MYVSKSVSQLLAINVSAVFLESLYVLRLAAAVDSGL